MDLGLLQQRIGYEFRRADLLVLALTHRSAGRRNNERMEFLGDAILNCTIAQALFEQFPHASEGDLSRMRAALVKGETLAEIAREFELGQWLRLGTGELKSGGHDRASILADVVEALIGAISCDSGMESAQQCIRQWWQERLAAAEPQTVRKDPKTRLQEYLQAQNKPLPVYSVESVSGEAHLQSFTVSCQVDGLETAMTATDGSRRGAEQQAAAATLAALGEETSDDSNGG